MTSPTIYLLDTNTVSYIADGRSRAARQTLNSVSNDSIIAISAITEGELLYGLARKPQAVKARTAIENVLSNVEVLAWDSAAARSYGTLRAQLSFAGKSLTPMDMLIAAQALATGATLVTRDTAFSHLAPLISLVNWATDL